MTLKAFDVLQSIDQRRKQTAGIELTPLERQREEQAAKATRDEARALASSELQAQRVRLEKVYKSLNQQKRQAAEQSSNQWDYARLAAERETARRLVQGKSPDALIDVLIKADRSGNLHAQRALKEAVLEKFETQAYRGAELMKMITLRDQIQPELDKLTTTPKQRELDETEAELSRQVREFVDDVNAAKAQLPDPAATLDETLRGQAQDSYKGLLDGISVAHWGDSASMVTNHQVTLPVEWDAADGE